MYTHVLLYLLCFSLLPLSSCCLSVYLVLFFSLGEVLSQVALNVLKTHSHPNRPLIYFLFFPSPPPRLRYTSWTDSPSCVNHSTLCHDNDNLIFFFGPFCSLSLVVAIILAHVASQWLCSSNDAWTWDFWSFLLFHWVLKRVHQTSWVL